MSPVHTNIRASVMCTVSVHVRTTHIVSSTHSMSSSPTAVIVGDTHTTSVSHIHASPATTTSTHIDTVSTTYAHTDTTTAFAMFTTSTTRGTILWRWARGRRRGV